MLVILARGVSFEIVQHVETAEQIPEPGFFHEIEKLAATVTVLERTRFNRFLCFEKLLPFRIEIIPRRGNNNSTRLDRFSHKADDPLAFASLHAAEEKNTADHIVGVP